MPGLSTTLGLRWEMRAAGRALEATAFELGPPPAGSALVRVAGCGVCHTDVGFFFDGVRPRASLPLTLGHEISGEVVDACDDHRALVGRAVIVPAVTPCGACADCRAGYGTLCAKQTMPGNDTHGGFATHVVVPARGLCVVDDPGALAGKPVGHSGATLAELSVVADAVTTPYQALRRAGVRADDFVVVVGLGGIGGFAAQIAHALGATVAGFDVNPGRLALLGHHGLDRGLDPRGLDPKEARAALRDFARERGRSDKRWKILECSGTKAGQELAFGLLGPGALLGVVGYTMDKVEVRLSNLMAFDASAVGNWGCLPELYPAALQLVLDGRVAVKPFVRLFPLSEIEDVLARVHERRIAERPVLVPGGPP
jgi:6-hydroxycyclohex-1-ene-1-carbonyl-CoA dehydrogenase